MKPTKPCRGCAGTGIGSHLSPREAQLLMQKVYLLRYVGPNGEEVATEAESQRVAKRYCRVDPWNGLPGEAAMRGRMAMSGPLAYVIAEVKRWLAQGWHVEAGSQPPDESACCEWCGGTGRPGSVLTIHEMEEALCQE